jgi:hypothetical protein
MPEAPAASSPLAPEASLDELRQPLQSPPFSPSAVPDGLRDQPPQLPARSPNSFYACNEALDDSSDADDAPMLRTASVSGHYPNLCAAEAAHSDIVGRPCQTPESDHSCKLVRNAMHAAVSQPDMLDAWSDRRILHDKTWTMRNQTA